MNKKIMMFFAVGFVLLLGTGMVFAYQGNPEVEGPNYTDERHETMQEAFDTNNFELWYSTMSENVKGRILEIVNKDNFDIFTEAREATLSGDADKATELKQSIGLSAGQHDGQGQGSHNGQGKGQKQMRGQGQNSGNCIYN